MCRDNIVIVWFSEKQQHSPLSAETGTSQSWELEASTKCVFPLLMSMEIICCIRLVPNKISSCIRPYYDLLQTQCGYNPLTSGVTYSSFPLTISPHCQAEGWWEDRTSVREYCRIWHQLLRARVIENVWQTVKRICI